MYVYRYTPLIYNLCYNHTMNIKNILVFLILVVCISLNVLAQTTDKDQSFIDQQVEKHGSWIISKVEPDFEVMGDTLSLLLKNNVTPLAVDRNLAGELLIIGQLSPPAITATQWHLGIYESEKSLMKASEKLAKEGWTPTGMDIQKDAAIVLYLKTSELLTGARMIKLDTFEQLEPSFKTYYTLGFLPSAISTFKNSLWVLYTKLLDKDITLSSIAIRTAYKDSTNTILSEELSKQNTSLIDVTYTVDDKVLLIFEKEVSSN